MDWQSSFQSALETANIGFLKAFLFRRELVTMLSKQCKEKNWTKICKRRNNENQYIKAGGNTNEIPRFSFAHPSWFVNISELLTRVEHMYLHTLAFDQQRYHERQRQEHSCRIQQYAFWTNFTSQRKTLHKHNKVNNNIQLHTGSTKIFHSNLDLHFSIYACLNQKTFL